MDGKTERPDGRAGIGKAEGKGKQNSVAEETGGAGESVTPFLIDSACGAGILGVSQPGFHRFMGRNKTTRPVVLGTLLRWRRNDLLRLIGKPCEPYFTDDILIDARTVAVLCSISRSMVYKLKELGMMPKPIMVGERFRWSSQEIGEWVEAGCPKDCYRKCKKEK